MKIQVDSNGKAITLNNKVLEAHELGIPREVVNGVYQPTSDTVFTLPDDATKLGDSALAYSFQGNKSIKTFNSNNLVALDNKQSLYYAFDTSSIEVAEFPKLKSVTYSRTASNAFSDSSLKTLNLSALETVTAGNAMYYFARGCKYLTDVDLSSLTTVEGNYSVGYMFYGCTSLKSVSFDSLTVVSGTNSFASTFYGDTALETVYFPSLKTIGKNSSTYDYGQFTSCFNGCTKLTTLEFPSLEEIYCSGSSSGSYGTFANNNKVEKMYFPKLHTITHGSSTVADTLIACKNIFYGCATLTELHFAAANQADIEASAGYATAWGRGINNVTIYFDL